MTRRSSHVARAREDSRERPFPRPCAKAQREEKTDCRHGMKCQIDAPSPQGYSSLGLTALGWGLLLGFTMILRATLHTIKSGDTSLPRPFEP